MTDEEEALAELKSMKPEELAKVDSEVKYWNCCVRLCKGFSRVKDFGISPFYYWKKEWLDMRECVLYCGKHWKLRKAGKITEAHQKQMYSGLKMILDKKPIRNKLK